METLNYFNYFTEIEEYFWRKRGAHLLVSPLDWAIVETWQKAGVPIKAVLRGIDRAFESWGRSRRGSSGRQLKSLAYCVDAVLDAAAEAQEAATGVGPEPAAAAEAKALAGAAKEPFARQEVRKFFEKNAEELRRAAESARAAHGHLAARFGETACRLEELAPVLDAPGALDFEDLERRLTVLEDKLTAALMSEAGEDVLLAAREEIQCGLASYRRKIPAAQLAQLERQYMQKRLLERFRLPRLSLFYLT